MYKLLAALMLIALNQKSFAFEIKPVVSNSDKWLESGIPKYREKHQDQSCNGIFSGIWYKADNAYPVHEIITVNAARNFCKYITDNNIFGTKHHIFSLECHYICDENDKSVKACDKGKKSSSNSPILSGSFFNDDPTGRIRNEGSGLWSFVSGVFEFVITIGKTGSITYASHNGENQFLHSMKSPKDNKPKDTRDRIVDYVAENFNLARHINKELLDKDPKSIDRLNDLLEKDVPQNWPYSSFLEYNKYKDLYGCKFGKYKELFYCNGSFGSGEYASNTDLEKNVDDYLKEKGISDKDVNYKNIRKEEIRKEEIRAHARTLALLALGSAMHVIQDSYSEAHVKRAKDTKIQEFYQYEGRDNNPRLDGGKKHCQYDAYVADNDKRIEIAKEKSFEFLKQLINPNSDKSNDGKGGALNTCRVEMKNWLKKNVFQFEREANASSSEAMARPDTCDAEVP